MVLLMTCHDLNHFGLDLLSKLVLPKDLRLFLGISHQLADPHCLVLIVLDQRVDSLRHLLGRCASLDDEFPVGMQIRTTSPKLFWCFPTSSDRLVNDARTPSLKKGA